MSGDPALTKLQRALADSVDMAQLDLAEAIEALALCHADPLRRSGLNAARHRVAEICSRILAAGDLSARIELVFGPPAAEPERFAAYRISGTRLSVEVPDFGEPVPDVGFDEAVADLRLRNPIGSANLAALGAEVADLYGGVPTAGGAVVYPHGFAAARAADTETATRVRDLLLSGLEGGAPTPDVAEQLVEAWDWPRAYSDMVTRTTYSTATSAGRFREARRIEETTGIRVGFVFRTAGDSDVRPGHRPLDGLVARQDDPVWRRWSPPGGYNAVERGALVMTDHGEKSIEEIRVGDRVWTFQGEYARVYGADAKVDKKRMVTLSMDGGHSVSVSVEHRVLTRRGWVHARNLREDDEIAVAGCKTCGKHVPTWREFCGPTCRNRALAKSAPSRHGTQHRKGRPCRVCSKPFDATNEQAQFCSWACKNEAQRDHRFCENCGKEIKPRGKKKPHRFCSQQCTGVASRKPDRPCDMCGVSLREALTKAGGTFGPRRRFCSFRCWRRFNGETSIEKKVRLYLEGNGVHIVQSAQVGRWEVDFLLPTYAVAVECDGDYWHASPKVKARDARKDAFLRSKGYLVLRLPENEIKASDGWKEKIHAVCEGRLDQARDAGSQAS